MTTGSNRYFLIYMESFGESYRDAMLNRDFNALQGLTAFDISGRWAVANTGSLVMSYLFKETIKDYRIGAKLPDLNYGVIVNCLRKRKINPQRLKMVIDAFEEDGFIDVKTKEIKSLSGKNKTHLTICLTDIWRFILTKYKRDKKQTITFPHVMGRQVYASYLARHKDQLKLPTGVTSFKNTLIILNNSTKEGYIDNKEGEMIFDKIGGVVLWNDFGEGDETKKEDIKFFTEDTGSKRKINSNVLKAYNKYLLPNFNRNSVKQGLK